MTRAVFLDRDGVLIASDVRRGRPYAVRSLAHVRLLPGVEEGLARLKDAGLATIVVTNQPDVVRGTVPRSAVEEIHEWLLARLPIDEIRVCYEVDGPEAICYKPLPTMLVDSASDRGIDLAGSYMVGDRWRDVGAGRAAGCRTAFLDCGYAEDLLDAPDWTVRSFDEAVEAIMADLGKPWHEGGTSGDR